MHTNPHTPQARVAQRLGVSRVLRPVPGTPHFQVLVNGEHRATVYFNSVHGYYAARLNGTRVGCHRYFPTPQEAARLALANQLRTKMEAM